MTIPEFTAFKFTGKIECICNLDFKMNAEIEITPKHTKMICMNCNRIWFYRIVNLNKESKDFIQKEHVNNG
jgi:hypothetical protein